MIGAHASGLMGLEQASEQRAPPPLARNPILEPDEQHKSMRRAFAPIQSGHADLLDGHHKARGTKGVEGGAGLGSVRHGELLFPEAPPRRGHASHGEGAAGLQSTEPFETTRGKARPPSASAEARNPVLLEGYAEGQLVDYTRFTPRETSGSQMASALGPGLLPVHDEPVRALRRPGTANAHGVATDALSGFAGASSSQLHRREFEENTRAHPHPTTEAALAALQGDNMSKLLNYQFSNGISDSQPFGGARAAEQAEYLEQLKALHDERAANEKLYEQIKARVSAPSLAADGPQPSQPSAPAPGGDAAASGPEPATEPPAAPGPQDAAAQPLPAGSS